jgi:AraC-like DNA-binding protein
VRAFGYAIPDFRSSEPWEDAEYSVVCTRPEPFDLVLANEKPDSWGAHVSVCLGKGLVLHLSKRIGVPAIESLQSPALREGVRTHAAADPMYGEALSTAVTLHLLKEYTTAKPRFEQSGPKLTRQMLFRAIEYIQDHLEKELTVLSIAEAVSMSPYYFTRLFKQATGKSPHQFLIEARVSKARHLLEGGNISIGEAGYDVGFVDQSHLTRHFKRVFGLPPKAFLCKSGL